MICRYQRPAKCCRATMTSDTTTSAPNRILVRQFTSRSKRPIWGRSTGCRGSWCSPHLCGERKSDFHEPAERTPSLLATARLDLGYNSGAECWSSMHKAQGPVKQKEMSVLALMCVNMQQVRQIRNGIKPWLSRGFRLQVSNGCKDGLDWRLGT